MQPGSGPATEAFGVSAVVGHTPVQGGLGDTESSQSISRVGRGRRFCCHAGTGRDSVFLPDSSRQPRRNGDWIRRLRHGIPVVRAAIRFFPFSLPAANASGGSVLGGGGPGARSRGSLAATAWSEARAGI